MIILVPAGAAGARAGVGDLCEAWSDNHSKSSTPFVFCVNSWVSFIPIYYLLLALMQDIKSKRVEIRVVRETPLCSKLVVKTVFIKVWPDEGLQIWL